MPMHNNAPTLEEVMQRLASEREPSPGHDLGLSYVIAKNILRVFSIIPRALFLRSRFGERYMQAYHVVASWFVVAFAVAGASLSPSKVPWADPSSDTGVTWPAILFLLAYSTMLALRFYGVLRRRFRHDFSVHSYSEGAPWWLWRKLGLPPGIVGLVIEPAIILIAGHVLGYALALPAVPFLAWLVAIAHFVEQHLIAGQERAKLLDAADNLIEQRLAQERLGVVHGQSAHAPAIAAPAANQQALQRELEQARVQAAATYEAPLPRLPR